MGERVLVEWRLMELCSARGGSSRRNYFMLSVWSSMLGA